MYLSISLCPLSIYLSISIILISSYQFIYICSHYLSQSFHIFLSFYLFIYFRLLISIHLSQLIDIFLSVFWYLFIYPSLLISIFFNLFICFSLFNKLGGSLSDLMAKVLACNFEVSQFELKSLCCVYFRTNTLGKGMDPFFPWPIRLGL